MFKKSVILLLCTMFTLSACSNSAPKKQGLNEAPKKVAYQVKRPSHQAVKRVLLISVDGLHASDLSNYVRKNPSSHLSALSSRGITYTNASSTRPSDSFPGLSAMITGGSPNATGVVYDDSYDRRLLPPLAKKAGDKPGTEVLYDETIDKDHNKIDGGGGINPAMLPRDPVTKNPVYPHQYIRVNNVFEVVKASGRHTAWADKHLAYDLVNGPSGKGVNDLYTPEITANGDASKSVAATEKNDDLKVNAILNEIDGRNSIGTKNTSVPSLFGMNFQAVSVAQKLPGNGYADSNGTFSKGLAHAMRHTDQSIGKIVNKLKENKLYDSTLIIISAKHGQSPMDRANLKITDEKMITQGVSDSLIAQLTADDVAYIWLTDQSKTVSVVNAIKKNKRKANIEDVYSYQTSRSKWFFNDPSIDTRTPDIVVKPWYGVVYTKPGKKIAEHGGINKDDTHVAMLVSFPGLKNSKQMTAPVYTAQIAPTILKALGLNPRSLKAVRMESTPVLPGVRK